QSGFHVPRLTFCRIQNTFNTTRDSRIPRRELLRSVWAYDADSFTRTVDVHIAGLRRKLEDDPDSPLLIVTIPGMGYRFDRKTNDLLRPERIVPRSQPKLEFRNTPSRGRTRRSRPTGAFGITQSPSPSL